MTKNVLALTMVLLLVMVGSAFADNPKLNNAWTTNVDGKKQDEFDYLTQTPYLFSLYNYKTAIAFQTWIDPFGTPYIFNIVNGVAGDLDKNDNQIWNTLSDWDSVKKVGTWSWSVNDGGGTVIFGNMVVVPEPISTTLFLLGAGVFGTHMLRKKKKGMNA